MLKLLNDKDQRVKTKILSAIMEDPEIILLLKEKYVDEEIWKFCIERDPNIFKKMKHPSEEICRFACEIDGSNLKHIRNRFRYIPITMTLCFAAVKSNPKAILYVPSKLLNDELKEIAFDGDPSLMRYFDNVRKSYIERLLGDRPSAIRYVVNPDEDIICNTIKKSPDICPYLNSMTQKMVETLRDYHPAYFNLYKNNIEIK